MKKQVFAIFVCLACSLGIGRAQSYNEWIEKADSCIEAEDWEKAETALLGALKAEPANAQNGLLLSNLGTVQRYCGKYDEALQSYSLALFMSPRSTAVLRNRAALYAEMDSLAKALEDYSSLLLLDDTDEDALYNRSLIYLERGDTIGCRNDLEKMLAINPSSSTARIGFVSRRKDIIPKLLKCTIK